MNGNDPAIVAWRERDPVILDADQLEVSFATLKHLVDIPLKLNSGLHTLEHRALMGPIRAFFNKSLPANQQANLYSGLLGLRRLLAIKNGHLHRRQRITTIGPSLTLQRRLLGLAFSTERKVVMVMRGQYYPQPSQYMAAAMAVDGYSQPQVQVAIKKPLKHRMGDTVTSSYVNAAKTRSILAPSRVWGPFSV
ncbi:hypothetical protein BBP40_005831 [Aspergillus hancockii]|nr:hypothetical protein BBP40_005831 [Aspergillus hancockii]